MFPQRTKNFAVLHTWSNYIAGLYQRVWKTTFIAVYAQFVFANEWWIPTLKKNPTTNYNSSVFDSEAGNEKISGFVESLLRYSRLDIFSYFNDSTIKFEISYSHLSVLPITAL